MIAGDISAPGTTKRIVRRTLEFAAYAYLYGEIEQVEEQERALDSLPEACSARCIEPAYMRRAHRPGRCTQSTHGGQCRHRQKETGDGDDWAARTPHCHTHCLCDWGRGSRGCDLFACQIKT